MISTNVRYTPANLMEVISELPRNMRGLAVEEASRYLVGNQSRGLMHYVQYNYVTRQAAYGRTFFSDRQRRKVMAMIRSGEITPGYPRRTGRMQRGWAIAYSGVTSRIINVENYATYVVGDPGQSRHEEMVGWRRVGLIIATNERGMIQSVDRVIQEYINTKGL